MKKLLTICFLLASAFVLKAQENKTYYYYAYGTKVGDYAADKVYITPLKKISINPKTHYAIVEASLKTQFTEYMQAELKINCVVGVSVFKVEYFNEAEATEYYTHTLAGYKSIVKINEFSYLAERIR